MEIEPIHYPPCYVYGTGVKSLYPNLCAILEENEPAVLALLNNDKACFETEFVKRQIQLLNEKAPYVVNNGSYIIRPGCNSLLITAHEFAVNTDLDIFGNYMIINAVEQLIILESKFEKMERYYRYQKHKNSYCNCSVIPHVCDLSKPPIYTDDTQLAPEDALIMADLAQFDIMHGANVNFNDDVVTVDCGWFEFDVDILDMEYPAYEIAAMCQNKVLPSIRSQVIGRNLRKHGINSCITGSSIYILNPLPLCYETDTNHWESTVNSLRMLSGALRELGNRRAIAAVLTAPLNYVPMPIYDEILEHI